jgi:uncharacterized protein (DUF433 family)
MVERIEMDPRICNGRPVIRGTRIPVTVILEQIGEGISWDDILKEYPEITREDIRAVLQYARLSIENAEVEGLGA